MRLIIADKVHVNSNVSKLGWMYPIMVMSQFEFRHAVKTLEKTTLGCAARKYHFQSRAGWSGRPLVRDAWIKEDPLSHRYYADNRLWGNYVSRDFWIVFKTDKDRTLALLLLE